MRSRAPASSPAAPTRAASCGGGIDSLSWVLLTMGDRPTALASAIESIPREGVGRSEIIVVVNGCADAEVPEGVRVVVSVDNVGIPAGRNLGADAATGEVIVFLDDDARVASPELAGALERRFSEDPALGVVSFRIADPDTGETSQRHVPRLGRSDPSRSGEVTSFLGGACAVRASAFRAVGGLPGDFFYALEETDLAWRLIAAGWRIVYDAECVVLHPRTEIDRHGDAVRLTSRNRVLLVRRLLPVPIGLLYVVDWTLLTLGRGRSTRTLRQHWAGMREGLRHPVERRPIGWRAIWRLTRLGRPPVI